MTIWQEKSGRDVSPVCPCLSLPGYQELGCLLYSSLFHYIFARTILSPTYHIIADLDYITCEVTKRDLDVHLRAHGPVCITLIETYLPFIKSQKSPCSIGIFTGMNL